MLSLKTIHHTVGNRTKWIVDYRRWLLHGESLLTQTVVASSTTFTVDTTSILLGEEIIFYANGGVLGETPTITVTVTTSKGQTKIATLNVVVTAP